MLVVDVATELSKHPEETFLNLVGFNAHNVGACSVTGESPVWEMHPDTDELFFILEGRFEITLWDQGVKTRHVAPQGSLFVVPQGIWHKPAAPDGARFMYLTPGESLHCEDPSSV